MLGIESSRSETMRPPEEEEPTTETIPEEAEEVEEEKKPEKPLEERELEDVEKEKLTMEERFARQRENLLRHYIEAYAQLGEKASRDPKEVEAAVRERIEDKELFTPTEQERKNYERNPDLAEGALEEIIRRWKNDTVRDILRAIEKLE